MGCLTFIVQILYTSAFSMIGIGLFRALMAVIWPGLFSDYTGEDAVFFFLVIAAIGVVTLLPAYGSSKFVQWLRTKNAKTIHIRFTDNNLLSRLKTVLSAFEYEVIANHSVLGMNVDLYANHKTSYMFIPGWNYFFFIHIQDGYTKTIEDFEAINLVLRQYVNKKYRIPPFMRYKIPLTAPIFMSENGFSIDVIDHFQKTRYTKSGDANALFFADLSRQALYKLENLPANGHLPLSNGYDFLVKCLNLAYPKQENS